MWLLKNRDELFEYLKSLEIYSRKCWPALHKNPPYQNQGTDEDYPISTFISNNVLWLPNGPGLKIWTDRFHMFKNKGVL